ncbi:DUF58 domain-containing protein [Candidatus Poribacteria bacterium]|jgi:uncharacterized protein (DUF58 family)|nr:DUF58 domain-containing protein [Candidatus Poribacteria bacterium]MBT5714774.1 DUF58 domain-containing protein [Candidatus Poribacteria bacterium]MBT7098018.1 DUF58 domain-containing protein [Candidatus Poribacteria bacterium]MBT7809558.1 DUF58 domain-containing protein [Candidatus Poribacteria bacterium]
MPDTHGADISPEIFKNVRRIEMAALRLVTHLFTGEYSSVFKGQGMEFAEVRPYEPGDDIRSIDWNVTARMRQPYVKRYVEERESIMMLLVDVSGSLSRAGSRMLKSRLAAEVAAVLAFAAIQNNDKVGLILFTDRVEKYVPPRKGRRHVLRVVREILTHRPERVGTDLNAALQLFARVTKRRSTAFLLSDFHAPEYESALRWAAARHDVVALEIHDPLEEALPAAGVMRWVDAETGKLRLTRTGITLRNADRLEEERRTLFHRMRIDRVRLSTAEPYVEPLLAFFRRRERRRQYA